MRVIRCVLGVEGFKEVAWRVRRDVLVLLEQIDDATGLSLAEWARLAARLNPEDFDPELLPASEPTTASPGSEDRIAVYAARVAAEQHLHHPDDVRSALQSLTPGCEPDLTPVRPQTQPLGHDVAGGRLPSRSKLGPRRQRRWSLRRGQTPLWDVVELYDGMGRLQVVSVAPASARTTSVETQREPERGELVAV